MLFACKKSFERKQIQYLQKFFWIRVVDDIFSLTYQYWPNLNWRSVICEVHFKFFFAEVCDVFMISVTDKSDVRFLLTVSFNS